jgi:hypothetical protein
VGADCTDGAECLSGRCQDTCIDACDDTLPCSDGNTCTDVSGGQGCLPTVAPAPPSKGCTLGGNASADSLSLLMLLTVLLGALRALRGRSQLVLLRAPRGEDDLSP